MSPYSPCSWRAIVASLTVVLSGSAYAQPCSYSLGADVTICAGTTTVLHAPPGMASYLWDTGETTPDITVSGGTHWCRVTRNTGNLVVNGDFSSGNTGFTSQFNYNSNLIPEPTYFIDTQTESHHGNFHASHNGGNFLMANAGASHNHYTIWSQTVPVCPGQTYTLDFAGCDISGTSPPQLDWYINGTLSSGPYQMPQGPGVWSTVSRTWTAGAAATSATFSIRVRNPVSGGSDIGIDDISLSTTLTMTDTIRVNVTPLPVVDLGPDLTLCTGQTQTLTDLHHGATFYWQDGSTNPSYTVTAPGTYSLTVTANGCIGSDAVNVAYNPVPFISLGPNISTCTGGPVLLDATTPGATYHWQDGSTGATFSATTGGTYTVDVTVNGCTGSDAINVYIGTAPPLELGPDLTLCQGQSTTFDVTVPGGTYLWEDGSNSPTRTISSAGHYSVTVTANGCSSSDAVNVSMVPAPSVTLPADATLCVGQTLHLDATFPGATYAWQDGATSPTYDVTTDGNYSVVLTLGQCTATDAINVSFTPPPTVDLGLDQTLCQGQSAAFDVSVPGGTYLWEDGSASPTRIISAAGTYSVTVSANGCSASDAVVISVAPLPTVTLPADATLCTGQTLLLDATTAGATYLWQDGSTTPTFNVTSAGNYSVTVTVNGCAASDAIDVVFNAPPTVDLGLDQTLCQGQSAAFDVTVPGGTYLWEDGSTAPTRTITAAGTYSVTVTANGCSASDAVAIAVTPVPTVNLPSDVTLCSGQTLLLDATTTGATYLWQDGSATPSFNVTAAGTYSVDVTVNGCTGSDAIVVAYLPPNAVDLGPDQRLCQGQSALFDVSVPGGSYLWEDGSTSPTRSINAAGAYNVTVTVNGCNASDAVAIVVDPAPSVALPPNAAPCADQPVHLNATFPGATYLWQDGSTAPTFDATTSGTYSVTVTLGQCSASDATTITYRPVPAVELGPALSICAGTPLLLDATTAGATYVWQDGSTNATFGVTASGTYSVTVDLNGCTASDSRVVTVVPLPAFDLGSDRVVCPGTAVTFNATTAGASYLWSDGSTSATLTTDVPGAYAVQVTVGQCSASDVVHLTNFGLQSVDLGADATTCAGTAVPLALNIAGATYAWNNGSTASSVNAATTGWWWVDATLNGCAVRDSVYITVVPLPTIDLGPDVLVCPGEQALFDATTPNATYLWNTAATGATIQAGAGEWNVRVTVDGCSSRDTVVVSERIPPVVDLGPDTMLCPGHTHTVSIPSGLSAVWSDGSTNTTRTFGSEGLYTVVVTDAHGCTASDGIDVTYATPIPVALGNDTTICQGTTLLLDATTPGATAYAWNNGAVGPTLPASGIGTYWVEVYQGQCAVSDTIDVHVVNGPSVHLPHDTTLCPGATLLLSANAGATPHVWQDGSTGPQFLVSATGTYWVRLTDVNSCVATDTIHVAYVDASGFELGEDTTICSGQSVVLNATLPGGTTTWSSGATGPALTVTTAGTYTATITVANCSVSDAIVISVTPTPTIDLGADQALCVNSDLLLSAQPFTGATYRWDDASTGLQRTVHGPGTYWARVTSNGCSASDTVVVTSVPLPAVALGGDTALCPGAALPVDVTTPNATYAWNDGSTAPVRDLGPGNWTVAITVDGCTASDSRAITAAPAPTLIIPADTVLCPSSTWTIDVAEAGATYHWQDGSTTGSITVSAAGAYTVSADLNGCTAEASVNVSFLDPTVFDLGPDTALCPGDQLLILSPLQGALLTWQDGSHASSYTVHHPGMYRLMVDAGGCSAEDSLHVTQVPLQAPDLGPDRRLCAGEPLTLTVDAGDANVFWNTGDTAPSIDVDTSGTYAVYLLLDGCAASDAIDIVFDPMITHIELGADTEMCPGHTLVLDASALEGTYSWSTGATDALITVTMPGTYTVLVQGTCMHATDTLTITAGECLPFIHVPNAFTPDGDGHNETFAPSVEGELQDYSFGVFDRWGLEVFHTTQRGQAWDGTFNGALAPDDVYVWQVEYRALGGHGVKQERLLGHVTLLR